MNGVRSRRSSSAMDSALTTRIATQKRNVTYISGTDNLVRKLSAVSESTDFQSRAQSGVSAS